MVDILILGYFRKGCTNFFIFSFDLAILDGIVMDNEISSQDQYLLLTEEANTEDVRLADGISLHKFEFLEVDIEEHELIFSLD